MRMAVVSAAPLCHAERQAAACRNAHLELQISTGVFLEVLYASISKKNEI